MDPNNPTKSAWGTRKNRVQAGQEQKSEQGMVNGKKGRYVQDLAVFERFVRFQRKNQADGARIPGIVPRKKGKKSTEF